MPHRVRADSASRSISAVDYTLRVDSVSSTDVNVTMLVHDAPASFRVAMATHTEYDDKYWRYVHEVSAQSTRGVATVARADSNLWRIDGAAGEVTIRYRVRFPASPQQSSWMGHLVPTGGLIGGPHSFMYVVGAETAPVRVALAIPAAWSVATGLRPDAAKPATYTAPNAVALIDSPMLVGAIRTWRFEIDGVPHEVAVLGHPGGATFDTALFVSNVERIARESARMFGRMPYDHYHFLFEDAASGGLEHVNSVSVGVQSATLARDPNAYLLQIAHEFFHTWNEVHVRPVSWIGLRHEAPAPTGELWLSEGVTLYYADLLLRRAGLRAPDSTRAAHVERLIATYLGNPSHAMVSPEATSRAFNKTGATGDYTPSMFTQGELLGVVLDLMIRDGSAGRRSLDDVMRGLASEFSVARGFTSADVERVVKNACVCEPHAFFERYVRSAHALEFDRWLAVIGLRSEVTRASARAADGSLTPDLRATAYLQDGESAPRLIIGSPETVWGRAGLHTGDRLLSWNGERVTDVPQVRTAISRLHIGDTVRVDVQRSGSVFRATVGVTSFERASVRLVERRDATAAQKALRTRWAQGT